jgi:hypothetical protein
VKKEVEMTPLMTEANPVAVEIVIIVTLMAALALKEAIATTRMLDTSGIKSGPILEITE